MALGESQDPMERYYMNPPTPKPLPAGQDIAVTGLNDGETAARMLARGPVRCFCPPPLRQSVRNAIGSAMAAGRLTRAQAAAITFLAPAGPAGRPAGPVVHDPGQFVEMSLDGVRAASAPERAPQPAPQPPGQPGERFAPFLPEPAVREAAAPPGAVSFTGG